MKLWHFGLIGLGGAAWLHTSMGVQPQVVSKPSEEPVVFILSGDTHGYLSPCGCTKPMTGGIRRRASAVRALVGDSPSIILENGGLTHSLGRQSELKAEALGEALKAVGVTAIHFTTEDAVLGRGAALSLVNLTDHKLLSTTMQPSSTNDLEQYIVKGKFLIGGVSTKGAAYTATMEQSWRSAQDAAEDLTTTAKVSGKIPVVMLEGSEKEARELAEKNPSIALIQYNSLGDPPKEPVKVGSTLIVTPGERAKHLIRLVYKGGKFESYLPVKLGPEFKDDEHVSRIYAAYLKRVSDEKLLEQLPREASPEFAGNKKCGSCHAQAMNVWEDSKHAIALKTLENEGHDRDPDCVSCHVVGLELAKGFRSRQETPNLTDVGCESCHGPGAAHSANPYKEQMKKLTPESCLKCHTTENSPGFDFEAYWAKIKH